MAVPDRIREVVDKGLVPSARAWCKRAGISGSYLGTLLTRFRRGEEVDVGVNTLVKLAGAANVSFTWLALGEGLPTDLPPPLPTNLRKLLVRRTDLPDALVRQGRLVLTLVGEDDLPEDMWEDYLEGLRREARRVGLEVAAARLDQRGISRR